MLRCLLVALLLAIAPIARAQDTRERWYVLELMDQHAGWMHTTATRTNDTITTATAMKLTMNRAGLDIAIEINSEFVETKNGNPVSIKVKSSFGGAPTDSRYEFLDDGVRQTTTAAGRQIVTMHPPIEGVWLTPAAAEQFIRQRLEAGADSFTLRTVDPQIQLQPLTMTYSDIEETRVELIGRTVTAFRAKVVNSGVPGIYTIEYLDPRGSSLRSETDMGGMKFSSIAADRELALAKISAPELMVSTFITPDKPIPGARTLKRATFTLSVPDGELALPPNTGSQRVERIDDRNVRVYVDATSFTPAGEVDREKYLAASSMLDTSDQLIIQLRDRALDSVRNDKQVRAEALRRFVYRHVSNKSLGVGFASASEVARTCEGDCSEHAVLLAALLRAEGIPARVASGLVYADQFAGSDDIFGYHMWTQALIEIEGHERWVDLDPTLPGSLSYDATHITLSTSSLKDGETYNSLVQLAPLLGRLSISVDSID